MPITINECAECGALPSIFNLNAVAVFGGTREYVGISCYQCDAFEVIGRDLSDAADQWNHDNPEAKGGRI